MDFNWGDVERVKGVYNFSDYDVLVAAEKAANVVPYMILDYSAF